MKRLIKLSLLALLFNIIYLNSSAGIMGSDIGWTCLGGDSFLIKVTAYNDCNGIAMGNISVNFNCATTGLAITTLTLTAPTPVDITPICRTSCTRCTNLSCSFPYGISSYSYQGIVHLNSAGSCCDIRISFTYGTRNSSITSGAAGYNYYNEALMNRCQNPCDNSPVYTNLPLMVLCIGQDFTYNQGVYDTALKNSGGLSDALTYEWAPPLKNYNDTIHYSGSYANNKPIFFWGFPNDGLPFPRGIHLDTQTGDIQFRPMKAETTVMVIKVKEFRNGVKIAELQRDIQIIVVPCVSNNPPAISTQNNIRTKTFCVGDPVTFNFSTSDPNTPDTVTISWNNTIPGAIWTNNNGKVKNPTATLTWVPSDIHAGSLPYTFTVTAKDNACPVTAQYTQAYQIIVNPKPEAKITVTDSGCGIFWFKAQRIKGNSPVYTWIGKSFVFTPKIDSTTTHQFQPGRYPYTMTMVAAGCSNTYYDTLALVDTFIQNTLSQDTIVCYGSTISLKSIVKHNSGKYKMKWGSGKSVFNSDTGIIKTLTVTSDIEIWSVASDSICKSIDTVRIKIHKPIGLNLGPDIAICGYGTADLLASCKIQKKAMNNIFWTDVKTHKIVATDTIFHTPDSGIYSCSITDTFGCISKDTIHLVKNPEVIATALGKTICYGNEAELQADSTGGSSVHYYWFIGSKLIGNTQTIKVKPAITTDYQLIVLETVSGISCIDSTKVRVTVSPLPLIKISPIDSRCINGPILYLNNYLKVNGNPTTLGRWSSPSYGLKYADMFDPIAAGISKAPGWKVIYEYTDSVSGCFNKDSSYVSIYDLPKPFAGVDEPVCKGTKKMLAGTPSLPPGTWRGTGVEGSPPNWRFNPDVPGIVIGGTYEAIYHYIDNNKCENEDTVKFKISTPPIVDAGNQQILCENEMPVVLTGNPPGGVWSGKGVSVRLFYPAIAKTGIHVLTYSYSIGTCLGIDSVSYIVYPKPARPSISLSPSDSFLECNLTKGYYNWYYRTDTFNAAISINKNIKRINPRNYCYKCYYSVVYTDSNGCVSDTSVAFHFVVNSIDQKNRSSRLIFYPNPAHSELFIENPDKETASLMMTDIFGKTVLEKKIPSDKSSISTLTYKPGVYFIFINGMIAGKLLIE